MPLILDDIFGSPNVGVYGFCNETTCLVPFDFPPRKTQRFHETLNVDVLECSVGGSHVIGALVSGNSQGILVPRTIRDYELKMIRKSVNLKVEILKEKWTAIGNLILANDYGAVVDPRVPDSTVERISNTLKVEAVKGEIFGLPFVGSLAVATNKGIIAHPKIREAEKENIEETLKVPVEPGTINGGTPYPKSGLLANSYGAIAGNLTSGPELMTISQVMGYP